MAIAAGAMFTRIPVLAFASFLVSVLALLNAPSIQDPNSSSSPWTSLIMSISAIINVELQKLMDAPTASKVAAAAASTTIA
ncbi:hypothetical protein P389DRAFT_47452 [Cystobasidium minutum MCA 4210]|uniref:uncharacterized protein n=1 Tax=Cystobasidium minutum MCA 4210 TaxID=1397322 RepID=UPI0034CEECD9|eukprot:jgi/Rhomi1/47452/CE47451_4019